MVNRGFNVSLFCYLSFSIVYSFELDALSYQNFLTNPSFQYLLKKLCSLVMLTCASRFRCNRHNLLLNSYICKIGNFLYGTYGHPIQNTFVQSSYELLTPLGFSQFRFYLQPLFKVLKSFPRSFVMPLFPRRGRITTRDYVITFFNSKLLLNARSFKEACEIYY